MNQRASIQTEIALRQGENITTLTQITVVRIGDDYFSFRVDLELSTLHSRFFLPQLFSAWIF